MLGEAETPLQRSAGELRVHVLQLTHRLIGADRMDLSPEHDCGEDEEEETLKAEEDEEDDSCWWREVTALYR